MPSENGTVSHSNTDGDGESGHGEKLAESVADVFAALGVETPLTEDTDESQSDFDIPYGEGELSRRELLREVTQETRFAILQVILMHPEGMPSLAEIDYVLQNRSRTTLREHLDVLKSLNVVETVEVQEEDRKRGLPEKYFRLTNQGEDVLEQFGFLSLKSPLREVYKMMEKPPKIQKYEQADRPDPDQTAVLSDQ